MKKLLKDKTLFLLNNGIWKQKGIKSYIEFVMLYL